MAADESTGLAQPIKLLVIGHIAHKPVNWC